MQQLMDTLSNFSRMQMKTNCVYTRNGMHVGGVLAARLVRWCGVAGWSLLYPIRSTGLIYICVKGERNNRSDASSASHYVLIYSHKIRLENKIKHNDILDVLTIYGSMF
jgi:hypothetical protein